MAKFCLLALAALLTALAGTAAGAGIASTLRVMNRAKYATTQLETALATNPLSKGTVAKAFAQSEAPHFLTSLFRKGQKLTLLVPSNKGYARYLASWPKANCQEPSLSHALAGMMIVGEYTAERLGKLPRGTRLATMSAVYLSVLSEPNAKFIELGVVNGYQKIVSKAIIIRRDAYVNTNVNFIVHNVDAVLVSC